MAEQCCDLCKHFAPLKEPFHYDSLGYSDGVTVYGLCCKSAAQHNFYPVYITGGFCKDFKKKPGVKIPAPPADGQMKMEDL